MRLTPHRRTRRVDSFALPALGVSGATPVPGGRAVLQPMLAKLTRHEPLTIAENTAFLRAYKSLDARARRVAFSDLQHAVMGMDGHAPKHLLRAWEKPKFEHVPELLLGMKTKEAYRCFDTAAWDLYMA